MGKLNEALETSQGRLRGPACEVGQLVNKLDPVDRDELLDALANASIRHSDLIAIIESVHEVTLGNLGYHRRGGCASCRRNGRVI